MHSPEKQGLEPLIHDIYKKYEKEENILYLIAKISIVPLFPNNDGIDHVDP